MAVAAGPIQAGVPPPMEEATARGEKWTLTAVAFDQLLAAFDPDREQAGARYQAIHTKLVKFFEWQGSGTPQEHADETINRLARRLAAGEVIENLQAYAYGVAKLLLREAMKATIREEAAHRELPEPVQAAAQQYGGEEENSQGQCFDECLAALPDDDRELIMTYYVGEGGEKIAGRHKLAARLGSDLNGVRVRAHRIRTKLAACVTLCLKTR